MKRDIQNIDDDIIRKKRLIEQILYSDEDIVEILDNPDIDPESPEDLVYENIFCFLRIPGTQDISKNFITFTVDDTERIPSNSVMKTQTIQFVIFVHKDNIKTKYGMARHDLLGYLIRDIFNLSNKLGPKWNSFPIVKELQIQIITLVLYDLNLSMIILLSLLELILMNMVF